MRFGRDWKEHRPFEAFKLFVNCHPRASSFITQFLRMVYPSCKYESALHDQYEIVYSKTAVD